MMHCGSDTLSRYLDHELSLPERRSVQIHLRDCDDCRRELERTRAATEALVAWGSVTHPMPRATEVRILKSIENTGNRSLPRWFQRLTPAALGSLAAAVLVVFTVNLNSFAPRNQPFGATTTALPPSVRQQAAELQRTRTRSAILGVQVTPPNTVANRRLVLLEVE